MADEYDAFGRKAGDDPLTGLGWSSSGSVPAERGPSIEVSTSVDTTTTPPTGREAVSVPPPAPRPVSPGGRSRRRARPLAALVVLAVFGVVAWQVTKATETVRDAVDTVRDAIPERPSGAPATVPPASDEVPEQRRVRSLVSRPGFEAGLGILRADVPGKLRMLRVESGRIDVTVHLPGGRIRIAQLRAGAQAASILSTASGGFPDTGAFGYAQVDPAAPARLIRAAGARMDRAPSQVSYLVLTRFGDDLQWGVYYSDGEIAIGDGRGRFVRRI